MPNRNRRAQPRTASSAKLIITVAVIAALAAFCLRLPGAPVLFAGVLLAAWMEPQPELTGSKGVPANDAEEARLARFGFWSDLRLGVFSPGALSPGWPVRASFLVAALCAALGFGVPVFDGWCRAGDAVAAFLLVALITEVRRRNMNAEGDHPAVRVDTLMKAGRVTLIAGGAVTAVVLASGIAFHGKLAGVAGHELPHRPGPEAWAREWIDCRPEWGSPDLWATLFAVAVLAGLAVVGRSWCAVALGDWRAVVDARASWNPRWKQLKMDPVPQVISVRSLTHPTGSTAADIEFQCPPHQGFTDFEGLAPKLHPMTGQGTSVSVLPAREAGPEGPIPGSIHPSRFRVVVFSSPPPDAADQGTTGEWAGLFLECAVRQAVRKMGYPCPVMNSCEPVPAETGPAEADTTETDPDGGAGQEASGSTAGSGAAAEPGPGAGLIWQTAWTFTDDMSLRSIASESGSLAATARTEAQVDATDTSSVYFGALDQAPPGLAALLDRRRTEDEWAARWANVKAVQQQNPAYQHNTYRELELDGGGILHTVGFMTRQGQDPAAFRTAGMEAALRPAMGASLTFLSSAAWRAGGRGPGAREGERHHGAFRLSWSTDRVPSTPTGLRPSPAAQYVLAGLVSKAFDAVKTPRPEVLGVRAVASAGSRAQLWEIRLRLWDGVTAGEVRGQLERMRPTLGAEWLRAEDADDGCTLYAGDPPAMVDLASPARDEAHLIALDWENAWRNSGVHGVAGALPKIMGPVTSMPKNDNIRILDYMLPDGVEIGEVRDKKVRNRLGNQTGNGWVLIRQHPDTPGAIRVLCAEKDPMPVMVPYDFEHGSTLKCLPFATGEDGEPVAIDWTRIPHMLMVGTSGPQPLDTRIPVPVSRRFPDGWARFGDLAAGDEVFTAHGDATEVVETHPVQLLPVFTLRLSDGQEIDCGPNHLFMASRRGQAEQVARADEMAASIADGWEIRVPDPVELPDAVLPSDPYRLGTWLAGMAVHGDCRIPPVFLRASKTQRLALLQGLMNVAGSPGSDGSCELVLCDERLAADALELIRSLGIKAYHLTGRRRIRFRAAREVFRLPRRSARIPVAVGKARERFSVEEITVTRRPVPMRCITVADDEHLYLCGGFVPTHNSGKSASSQCLVYGALTGGFKVVVIDPTKGGSDFAFADDHLLYRATKIGGKPEVETYRAGVAAMKAVYAEGKRRIDLCNAQGVGSYRELDSPPDPILVFFDEFAGILDIEKGVPSKPYDDPELEANRLERKEINDCKLYMSLTAANIAAELRSAGIHLILCTQRLTAKLLDSVPKGDTLRTNLARAILGKATFGEMQSALRNPMTAPEHGEVVPKGRGIFEPLESAAVLTQGWFAAQDQYREQLHARVPTLGEDEKLDIGPFMPKKQDRGSMVGVARPVGGGAAVPAEAKEVEVGPVEVDDSFWDDDDFVHDDTDGEPESREPDLEHAVDDHAGDPAADDPAGEGTEDEPSGEEGREADADAPDPVAPPIPDGCRTLVLLEPAGGLCPVDNDWGGWAGWPDWEAPDPETSPGAGKGRALSRTMLTRIGGLAGSASGDDGAALVWTPGRPGANKILAPHIGAGDPLPHLPGVQDGTTGWEKLDALIAHLSASPATTRVCWIDGDLHPATGGIHDPDVARELLATAGIDALLIAADPAAGLTPMQMDDVEEWIAGVPASTPASVGSQEDEEAEDTEDEDTGRQAGPVATVLVCEVDGALRGPFGGDVTPELLQALSDAEEDGKFRLAWLTTWGESVNASIGRRLGGELREVIPIPDGESAHGELKLDALEQWLALNPDVKHVIWADPVAREKAESGFASVGDVAARVAREHGAELTVADLTGGELTPASVGGLAEAA